MKNIPVKTPMFKVTYEKMEGDNYAGGWVTKYAYIDKLGDCDMFEFIKKVEPIVMIIYNEVDKEQINAAIKLKKSEEKTKLKKEKIDQLKKILKELEYSNIDYKKVFQSCKGYNFIPIY